MLELLNYNMNKRVIFPSVRFIAGTTRGMEHVDTNNNKLNLTREYFNNHPIWSNIKEEIIDSQHMIKIPKFYFRNEDHKKISISDKKYNDSFKCHPAFLKNGIEQDCFWIGKYVGSNDGSNKIASQPNVLPIVNINFTQSKLYCSNRNVNGITGFCMTNIYMISAIQMLYLVEYANTDCQSAIGPGHVNGSSADLTSGPYTSSSNYRGIIGLWGNIWEWIDGIENNNIGELQLWDNLGNETFINTKLKNTSLGNGYIGSMLSLSNNDYDYDYDLNDLFISKTKTNDVTTAKYPDIFNSYENNTKCIFGGNWNYGNGSGLFCIQISNFRTNTFNTLGCRLAKI